MAFISRVSAEGDSELSILIPDNWQLIIESKGSFVFSTDEGKTNALQITIISFSEDKSSDLTEEKLIEEAKQIGKKLKLKEAVKIESGECLIGNYATAIYQSEENNNHIQVWYISNGETLIFANLTCENEVKDEIKEQAGEIAKRVKVQKI